MKTDLILSVTKQHNIIDINIDWEKMNKLLYLTAGHLRSRGVIAISLRIKNTSYEYAHANSLQVQLLDRSCLSMHNCAYTPVKTRLRENTDRLQLVSSYLKKGSFVLNLSKSTLPSVVSQRAMAPQISSKMIIIMRLMIAAVVLTVALMLERAAGQVLMCKAALMLIRYRITPKTMANVTAI